MYLIVADITYMGRLCHDSVSIKYFKTNLTYEIHNQIVTFNSTKGIA